jgi:hypothetical protein
VLVSTPSKTLVDREWKKTKQMKPHRVASRYSNIGTFLVVELVLRVCAPLQLVLVVLAPQQDKVFLKFG